MKNKTALKKSLCRTAAVLALAGVTLVPPAVADNDENINAARRALPFAVPSITLGRMLVAGEGIGILPLRTSFAQVIRTLGRPKEERRTGLLGKIRHWLYAADDGSIVVVSGEKSVESINVMGSPQSTFATIEGVTFGADSSLVRTFYGTPQKSKKSELVYARRGIAFGLSDRGQVTSITVSIPQR